MADQAKTVTANAGQELQDLFEQTRHQLREQATTQQGKVVSGLRSLVEELRTMADKGGQSGPATQLVRQGSQFVDQAADWFDQREPGDLVEEARKLGRRKPGAFLAGAALAGVLAGRLTRGTMAAASSDDTTSGHDDRADRDGRNARGPGQEQAQTSSQWIAAPPEPTGYLGAVDPAPVTEPLAVPETTGYPGNAVPAPGTVARPFPTGPGTGPGATA